MLSKKLENSEKLLLIHNYPPDYLKLLNTLSVLQSVLFISVFPETPLILWWKVLCFPEH